MDTPGDQADEQRAEATRRLEHELGVLVRRIRRNLAGRAQRVHPQLSAGSYSLLLALREGEPTRASQLSESFSLDKGAVSRRLHMLGELGLVERSKDPRDGRALLLNLTGDARRRLAEVDRDRRVEFDRALAQWSVHDLSALAQMLEEYNTTLG